MTRIPEMLTYGITCAFGHDCVMDPWYSLGQADMLEVASMGLHIGHMSSREAMRTCFDLITSGPAKIMHLDGYGIEVGNKADMVLLQAADPIEAIRLKANRLAVIKSGKVIASSLRQQSTLTLPGRPASVDASLVGPR
jgi:cytosine deaminase